MGQIDPRILVINGPNWSSDPIFLKKLSKLSWNPNSYIPYLISLLRPKFFGTEYEVWPSDQKTSKTSIIMGLRLVKSINQSIIRCKISSSQKWMQCQYWLCESSDFPRLLIIFPISLPILFYFTCAIRYSKQA